MAAGGIADGRGLAAALMLGAAGITLGTGCSPRPRRSVTQRPPSCSSPGAATTPPAPKPSTSSVVRRGPTVTTGGPSATTSPIGGPASLSVRPNANAWPRPTGRHRPRTTRSGCCGRATPSISSTRSNPPGT
ncbi:MAG: hypothetical protein ACXWBN_18755 [Acidimicrobiales bacterium]